MLVAYYPPTKGGVQIVAEQYSEFYSKLGYNVQIITNDSTQTHKKMTRTGKFGEKILSVKPNRTIQSVPLSFRYFIEAFLAAFCLKQNFTLLIHHPAPQDSLLSIIFKFLFSCKIRIVFHAEIINKNKILTAISNPIIKLSFFLSDQIIFTTEKMKSLYESQHGVKGTSFVISIANPHLVDEVVHPKKRDLKKPLKLIFVGRLVPYKGIIFLIEALSGIDNVHLKIIGGGKEKLEIETLIQKLDLSQKIDMYEKLDDIGKNALLKDSDVFVFPSISIAEAFGIAQIEAMQYGLPVINTDLASGVPEVSKHGISGLTVPPCDIIALQNAIIQMRDDAALYDRLSTGAILRSKNYDQSQIYSQFIKATQKKREHENQFFIRK